MERIEIVKRKDGITEEVKFKTLGLEYLDKIMELQEIIINALPDKQLYASSGVEEFKNYIEGKGEIIGCVTKDDKLIAMGVYAKLGLEKSNYGYDIGLKDDELLKVGQIESTIVLPEYRGNKLQKKICEILEEIGKNNGTPIMMATASPYNQFSLKTFLDLGYEIVKEKLKYGGLKRCILKK